MSLAFGIPFVSGKDSLNNFTETEGRSIAIPHTLLVSAMAVMDDVNRAVTMDLKRAGNRLYVVGNTYDELAGSEYCACVGGAGRTVPQVRVEEAHRSMTLLSSAIEAGLVASCHDMSEGGFAVALAEMCFAGGRGAVVDLKSMPLGERVERDDILLFSESNSRFVVEVPEAHRAAFESRLEGAAWGCVGVVTDVGPMQVTGLKGNTVMSCDVHEMKAAWKRPLDW
jgi:phosphoribosylformylglycinamidine synthase